MASLIPGYEYDIFISYRQKDNKGDRWVSEFVDALKDELESTFKEEISVYFDINPHTGLLETHDVDESLKDKLKCLVFIPIISRTYCDPRSFAWEHEFKAFIGQASKDEFGLKVKLPGGNVGNRVLPVQIHDLDAEDNKLFENELKGFIRGIEFIYKEPGVDRPLTASDNEEKNLNNTNYRNQINKVALAIKEIITAIKKYNPQNEEVSQDITKPLSAPRKNYKTTIIAGLSVILVLVVLGFIFSPKLFKSKEGFEKSIAVLPFLDDSPDKGNSYIINGLMDEITLKLQAVKALTVPGRTSVEKYRNTTKNIREIAKELNVNYIVEGSAQKIGNIIILRVQLLDGINDKHLWGNSYKREIESPDDIVNMIFEIAQEIGAELKAVITPEERVIIEKTPTTSLTAYDFFQQGQEEQNKYKQYVPSTRVYLDRANELYKKALVYDSAYAQAYVGLATVYWARYYWKTYFSDNFLDSVLILSNKALSINNKLSEAYIIRANYYQEKGLVEQAFQDCTEALKYNPNDYRAYFLIGNYSISNFDDFVKAIDNYHKAIIRYSGSDKPWYLRNLASSYLSSGFNDKAKYYFNEAYKLDGDSARYLTNLATIESFLENFEGEMKLLKKAHESDSTYTITLLDYNLMPSIYDEERYLAALKVIESYKRTGILPLWSFQRIGYAIWKVGKKEEALYYFNQQIKYDEESIRLNRDKARRGDSYYDLASCYAFLGDKEEAYKYLDDYNKMKDVVPKWRIIFLKHDPLLNSLRDDERFQKILMEMEAKFQALHEDVKKWLEVHNML
jgi:TolB-like protein